MINDGSKDETIQVLQKQFALAAVHPIYQPHLQMKPLRALYRSTLHPNLVVIDKDNGGKADSLNAGSNLASNELVCAIDADTLIEPDALQRMVRPFIESDSIVAAGATIRPVNGAVVKGGRVVNVHVPHRPMAGIEVVEDLRAFLFGRLGWNRWEATRLSPGRSDRFVARRWSARAAIRMTRSARIWNRSSACVASDAKTGAPACDFIPDPVAWTEVPDSLRALGNQRDRWH